MEMVRPFPAQAVAVCMLAANGVQNGAQPLLCMPVPETRPVTAPHIDQWRVFLQQCPDCGEVHGKSGTPDHHVYRYTDAAPEDLVSVDRGRFFRPLFRFLFCFFFFCVHVWTMEAET